MANLIVRVFRLALLLACVLVIGASSPIQLSAQTTGGSEPREPASDESTPAPTPPGTPVPAISFTPGVIVPPTPNATATAVARRADCERYVAVLSGRKEDKDVLNDPGAIKLAQLVPDLVTCGAVVRDSVGLCEELYLIEGNPESPTRGKEETTKGFIPEGPYKSCRRAWSTFHELRHYPKIRWIPMDDVVLQECKAVKEMAQYCEPQQVASRTGDASKCAKAGPFESICRATLKLDKSLCRTPTGNDFLKKNGAQIAKGCAKNIESNAFLAKGLESIARSGPARERQLAKAALGQAGACADYEKATMELCTAQEDTGPVSTPGTPSAEKPEAGSSRTPPKGS